LSLFRAALPLLDCSAFHLREHPEQARIFVWPWFHGVERVHDLGLLRIERLGTLGRLAMPPDAPIENSPCRSPSELAFDFLEKLARLRSVMRDSV
jgi:hypothetical protein